MDDESFHTTKINNFFIHKWRNEGEEEEVKCECSEGRIVVVLIEHMQTFRIAQKKIFKNNPTATRRK